jgi:putative membrane protein
MGRHYWSEQWTITRAAVMDPDANEETVSRTALAEDRTILSNERTFAGWLRTSLGAIAIGLAFRELFRTMEPTWLPRAIATAFLMLAVLILWLAARRAASVTSRLSPHVLASARPMNLHLISLAVSLLSGLLIAAIWLL